ncbi:MAG: glycosyltransferase family 4 protein [Desulfonatronovibrionaceae bacterium]
MNNELKLLHIITGLSTGGAETMLYKLLSRMDKGLYASQAVSLLGKGPMAERIEALGVPVQAVNMSRGVPDPRGIWRLSRLIRNYDPDVIQTWMYHADLIGGLAAKMAGNYPVVWNIRHSNLHPRENKKTTIWTAKACALLSRWIPKKIVCCSEESRRVHASLGYDQDRMLVIPNGFDLEAFGPNKEARRSLRSELGLGQDALLIGMAARFNPQKDHFNLVQASKHLKDQGLEVYFMFCGPGMDRENEELCGWIKEIGLEDRFFLLGPKSDMPRITAALDVACLSSAYGEGFPNVLGEAMACEVPCVATNVGDSAEIVGDTGRVVPPRDPETLAMAIKELIDMETEGRTELGKRARQRVEERFELGKVVRQYEDMYRLVCEAKNAE